MNYKRLSKEILIAFHLKPEEFDDLKELKEKLNEFIEAQQAVMDVFSTVAASEGYAHSKLLKRLLGHLYYLHIITLGMTNVNQVKLIKYFTKELLKFYKLILSKSSVIKIKRMSKYLMKLSKKLKGGVNFNEFDEPEERVQG